MAEDFPDSLALLEKHPNIVIFRTFSKIHSLSGLRVGYSISHPDLVTCLHMVRQPFNVNRIAQAGARAALEHFDKTRERIAENREQMDLVRNTLLDLGFVVPPSQTNFLLAVPPGGVEGLIEALMNRGIIVRDMSPFGLVGAMRVSIGTPDENQRFIEAMRELI